MAIRKTYSVKGMHCEKCVARVKNALEEVDGVIAARVSLEKENALVKTDGDIADDVLIKAIADQGFEASLA